MASALIKDLTKVLMDQRPSGMSGPDAERWIREHVDGFASALMTHFQPWFTTPKTTPNHEKREPIGGLTPRAADRMQAELSLLRGDIQGLHFKRTLTTALAFEMALNNRQVNKADTQHLSSRVLGEQWWIDSALSETEREAIPWMDATWWPAILRDALAADLVDPGGTDTAQALQAMEDEGLWERFTELDRIVGIGNVSARLDAVQAGGDVTEDDLLGIAPAWPVETFLRRWPKPARTKADHYLVPSGELDVVPLDEAVLRITDQLDRFDEAEEVYLAASEGSEILIQFELERMRAARTADILLADAEWWLTQYPPSTSSSHARFQTQVAALRERYDGAVESLE